MATLNRLSLVFFLFATSCRSGHFESQTFSSREARLHIEFEDSKLQKCGKPQDSDPSLSCYRWELQVSFYDQVDRKFLKNQKWKLSLKDRNGKLLSQQERSLNHHGQAKWISFLHIPSEYRIENFPVLLEFKSEIYGELEYMTQLDLFEPTESKLEFEVLDKNHEIPQLKVRSFELEVLNLAIVNSESISPTKENVRIQANLRLFDKERKIPLSFRVLEIAVEVPSESQMFTNTTRTNENGVFSFGFLLERNLFAHEVQKKVAIRLSSPSNLYPHSVFKYLVISLNPNDPNPLKKILSPSEALRDPVWRNYSLRYASQEPPTLQLEQVEMAETTQAKEWLVSSQLELLQIRRFLFDLKVSLQRKSFDGIQYTALPEQKFLVKIGRAKLETHGLEPKTWTDINKQTISSTPEGRLSFEYLAIDSLATHEMEPELWFLLETSIYEYPVIPSSYHLISWPSRFSKPIPRKNMIGQIQNSRKESENKSDIRKFMMELDDHIIIPNDIYSLLTSDSEHLPSYPSHLSILQTLRLLIAESLARGNFTESSLHWDFYRGFFISELLDQDLKNSLHFGSDEQVLEFEVRALGKNCVHFVNELHVLSLCHPLPREWTGSIRYHLQRGQSLFAQRLLPEVQDIASIRRYKQPAWLLESHTFNKIASNFRAY